MCSRSRRGWPPDETETAAWRRPPEGNGRVINRRGAALERLVQAAGRSQPRISESVPQDPPRSPPQKRVLGRRTGAADLRPQALECRPYGGFIVWSGDRARHERPPWQAGPCVRKVRACGSIG
jgi:hypothetical protein